MIERQFIHIHKGKLEDLKLSDKMYCGILFEDCKQVIAFRNVENHLSNICPKCLEKYYKLKYLQEGIAISPIRKSEIFQTPFKIKKGNTNK